MSDSNLSQREESLTRVLHALMVSLQACGMLTDQFFVDKLLEKIEKILLEYTRSAMQGNHDVAQSIFQENQCVASVDDLVDLLQSLLHIAQGEPTSLLRAQQEWLMVKLILISKPHVSLKTVQKKSALPLGLAIKIPPLTSNQKQIADFIKVADQVRARDIVEKFQTLSERTVKRSLKDLVDQGIIGKRHENHIVLYYYK